MNLISYWLEGAAIPTHVWKGSFQADMHYVIVEATNVT